MQKIVFTGGGSAGHVVPNLALMTDLQKCGDIQTYYVGTSGIEKRLISPMGTPFFEIACPKLIRSFTLKNLKIPFSLSKAIRDSRKILRELQPDLVFSKGGFVSLPVCIAARKEKIPVLTHESDLSPGLATRLIAKKCRYVLTSFPETANRFKNGRFTGSPLRSELFDSFKSERHGQKIGKKVLLVFGGGSGAEAINQAIYSNLERLAKAFEIVHIVGENNVNSAPTHPSYHALGYIKSMQNAYKNADVVLARAGSNTLFELAALRLPALIVPLEKSSRGDQKQNARYFESRGLIRVASEAELSHRLCEKLLATLNSKTLQSNLSANDFTQSGNEKIIRIIRETIRSSQKKSPQTAAKNT